MHPAVKVLVGFVMLFLAGIVVACVLLARLFSGGSGMDRYANLPTFTPAPIAEQLCPTATSARTRASRSSPVIWCADIGPSFGGALAVADGTVFVATGKMDPLDQQTSELIAVDAATGAERWRLAFPIDTVLSDPAAVGGLVFVCVIGPGAEPGVVLAADAATGAERWQVRLDEASVGTSVCTAPRVEDGVLFVAKNNRVHALDAQTGALRWESERLELWGRSGVALAGDLVVVNSLLEVIALDRASGSVRWRATLGPAEAVEYVGAPVAAGGLVCVSVRKHGTNGFNLGELAGIDAQTGSVAWRVPSNLPAGEFPVTDGRIVIAEIGVLAALDANSGEELWRARFLSVSERMALADGLLYVRSNGPLLAIDATTGREAWRVDVGDGMYRPVAVAGVVYIDGARNAAGNNVVYAIDGRPTPVAAPVATPVASPVASPVAR